MNKTINKWALSVAVAILLSVGSASAQTFIVNGTNLDNTSTTEGVKNGTGAFYFQGFATGPTGDISQLTFDLSLVATSSGHNTTVTNPDSATFYLYSYTPGHIGSQIGSAIGTVTVANVISAGTFEAYISGEDIYQYNLISSLSSIDLSANTDYAIYMVTSGGEGVGQDIGWAESNTEATGDMGELNVVNDGSSNQSGAYGQMEIAINAAVPETSSTVLLLGGVLAGLWLAKRKLTVSAVAG